MKAWTALLLSLALIVGLPTVAAQDGTADGSEDRFGWMLTLFLAALSVMIGTGLGFLLGGSDREAYLGALQSGIEDARRELDDASDTLEEMAGNLAHEDGLRNRSGGVLTMSQTIDQVSKDLGRVKTSLEKGSSGGESR